MARKDFYVFACAALGVSAGVVLARVHGVPSLGAGIAGAAVALATGLLMLAVWSITGR